LIYDELSYSRYVLCQNAGYAEGSELIFGCDRRSIHVDAAAGIFDHDHVEALAPRVFT
jgi:hypothetical protein